MYMNFVFDATLNDNKWVNVLQGHFLNLLKIIANLTKIDILHNWPCICTNGLNMKHSFCNYSPGDGLVRTVLIDGFLPIIGRRRWRHTLLWEKSHPCCCNVFLFIKYICNKICRWATTYGDTNTHSIKILSGGLAHGEVLLRIEANVSGDFMVPLRYFTRFCWTPWQTYEILKCRSLFNQCIMHPITIPMIFISGEYPGTSTGRKS